MAKKTDELNKLLENTTPDKIAEYLDSNKTDLKNAKKSFYYYMKDVLDDKRILLKDVYSFAGVSESYGEQILRMEKHTKNRDLIIRFCIAGHFDLYETNKALKLYGMSPLYSRDARDVCLIVAINKRIFDFGEIDRMLMDNKLKQISPKIK